MKTFFQDMFTTAFYRLKIMFRSKSVIISYVVALIITAIISVSFFQAAEEKSGIMIGVTDLDNTELSKTFIKRLHNNRSLIVVEGDTDELIERLKDNELMSVFVIEKGFKEKVEAGNARKLMTDYHLNLRSNVSLLSDIVLSEILDEICYVECLNRYHEFADYYEIMNDDEYKEFAEKVYATLDKSFSFDFKVINVTDNVQTDNDLDNSIIYKIFNVGIIGVLISFIVLFAANTIIMDKGYKTNLRIYTSMANRYARLIGDTLSLFVVSGSFTSINCLILRKHFGFSLESDNAKMFLLMMLFTLATDLIFMALTQIIDEPVALQLIGAYIVAFFGVLATLDLVHILLPFGIKEFSCYIPNSWLNTGFDDILMSHSLSHKYHYFLVCTLVLAVLNILIRMLKKEVIKNED